MVVIKITVFWKVMLCSFVEKTVASTFRVGEQGIYERIIQDKGKEGPCPYFPQFLLSVSSKF